MIAKSGSGHGRIDVVIPAFNGAEWIGEAISSLLSQTHPVQHIYVVDNGSTDETCAIATRFEKVSLLHNPEAGTPSVSRNMGARASHADFIAFLDQDDILHPDHFSLLVEALDAMPESGAVCARAAEFREEKPEFDFSDGKIIVIDTWKEFPFLTRYEPSLFLFRKTYFDQFTWPEVRNGYSDYEMWLLQATVQPVLRLLVTSVGRRRPTVKHRTDSSAEREIRMEAWKAQKTFVEKNIIPSLGGTDMEKVKERLIWYEVLPGAVREFTEQRHGVHIHALAEALAGIPPHLRTRAMSKFQVMLFGAGALQYTREKFALYDALEEAADGRFPDLSIDLASRFQKVPDWQYILSKMARYPMDGIYRKMFTRKLGSGRKTAASLRSGCTRILCSFISSMQASPAFLHPEFIAIEESGAVCVADPDRKYIAWFGADGVFSHCVTNASLGQTLFTEPEGIAFRKDGALVVVDSRSGMISGHKGAGGILFTRGESGTLPGQLWHAEAIAFDQQDRLLVADANNHRISVFTSEGDFLFCFGQVGFAPGEFNCPQSVRSDSQGRMWVVDMYNHRVQVFDQQGKYLMHIGEQGDGPAQFDMPCGLYIDRDDRVYITDIANKRVQILSPEGAYLGEISGPMGGLNEFGVLLDVAVEEKSRIL